MKFIGFAVLLLLLFVAFPVVAETGEDFKTGLALYEQKNYAEGAEIFLSLLENPEAADYRKDSLFWLSKCYLAGDMLEKAENGFSRFIDNYPDDEKTAEAYYLLGRTEYLLRHYNKSSLIFNDFCRRYTGSPFLSSGYFWLAESFYSLGEVKSASIIYRKIITDYPDSPKADASRYKLSLIDFIIRENSLLELLNWSHKQYLLVQDDFMEKEKKYRDSLSFYQEKIAELSERGDRYYNYNELLNIKEQALDLKSFYLEEMRRASCEQ